MPDYSEHQTENAVIADIAAAAQDVRTVVVEGVPYIGVPKDISLIDSEHLLARPRKLKATREFVDPESFANYINRYKSEASLVVSKRKASRIECFLDYHDSDQEPRWCHHNAVLTVAKHEDYIAWEKLCSGEINQVQFAEAVDDLMHTIAKPEGAVLQDMILKFQAMRDMRFSSAINLTDGTCSISYSEQDTNTTNKAQFPTSMTLVLPVFEGEILATVDVRIRYRARDQKLSFYLSIARKTDVERKAWQDICQAVANMTDLDVLNG